MEEEEDVVLLELNHYSPFSQFLKHAEDCFCRTLFSSTTRYPWHCDSVSHRCPAVGWGGWGRG